MKVANSIIVLLLLMLATGNNLSAAPANPEIFEITQPDGAVFKARKHGDEFQSWTETEDGHTVVRNHATKEWEYALQNPDETLRPSGHKVIPGKKAPDFFPKRLKPPRNKELELQMHQMLKDSYKRRLKKSGGNISTDVGGALGGNVLTSAKTVGKSVSAATNGTVGDFVPVPVSGSKNLLIVLISFADRALQTTPASWYAPVFDETKKSVAKYYRDNSFGMLTLTPVAHTQPGSPPGIISVTISDNHPDYGDNTNSAIQTIISNHALSQASIYVNFASLDVDNDGILEPEELSLYFIYAGYEESNPNPLPPNIHAHASTGTLAAGTKTIKRWAQSGELTSSSVQHPMGVITHELGHSMCGLPDLYDTSHTNEGLGYFSLMAGGSWGYDMGEDSGTTPSALDIWSREYLGWSAPVTPNSQTLLSLSHPLSGQNAAYKLITPNVSSTEYFLIENRQPTGWDLGLRGKLGSNWSGGLIVTHVDITSGTAGSNDINSYTANNVAGGGHQGVVPVQASISKCDILAVGLTCRGDATTLFYAGNNINLTPVTTPNTNYYNGSATNFSLVGVSAPSPTMTGTLYFTAPVNKTLNVVKAGSGVGTVTSSPAGISCGASCSANLTFPSTITLTAVPSTGSAFTGWSGACTGTANPCILTSLEATDTVQVNFSLTVPIVSEGFSIASLPAGWTAIDILGSGKNWRFDGGPCNTPNSTGGSGNYALAELNCVSTVLNADISLFTSIYDLRSYRAVALSFKTSLKYWNASKADVDVSSDGGVTWANVWRKTGANGAVYGPSTENIDVTSLTAGKSDVMIRFRYYTSSYGTEWQVDDFSLSGVIKTWTITTNVPGGNGSITCTSPVAYNSSSVCTIVPVVGYHLASFSIGGVDKFAQVSNNSYTINGVTADQVVSGSFVHDPVSGSCGNSNGTAFNSSPADNLCSSGTASALNGSGPWNWICYGLYSGSDANCSANLDNTPPVVTFSSTPMNYSNQTSGAIAFRANEAATFECKIDNDSSMSCTSPFSYNNLANGQHTVTVRATDSPGNISAPVMYSWIIDSALLSSSNIQLPHTGQMTCYDTAGLVVPCAETGQDGGVLAGIPWPNPRFTDNSVTTPSELTVTDNLTGLIWAKNGKHSSVIITWQQALDYVKSMNSVNFLGHNDWRLPNKNELESLVNRRFLNPSSWLNGQGFTNVLASFYWSSSTNASSVDKAWYVNMGSGLVNYDLKTYGCYIWPVRSGLQDSLKLPKTGQTNSYLPGDDGDLQIGLFWPSPRFNDNGDQTMTDNLTGLSWTKNGYPAAATKTWQGALDYIKTLNSGSGYLGHIDWRLPNLNELASLLNGGQGSSVVWLNGLGFSSVQVNYSYWSSNTNSSSTDKAWYFSVTTGSINNTLKTFSSNVWPVRGGQVGLVGSLALTKAGTGTGGVSGTPSGISCGSTCVASYATGTSVTLIATPDSNSTFTGWGGVCNGTDVCQVAIEGIKSVAASFTLKPPVIGTCGDSNNGTYDTAPTLNLCSSGAPTALAGTGPWSWNCNGLYGGTDVACSANIQTYVITATVTGGNGTVACTSPVNSGTGSTCTITPANGYGLNTFTDNNIDKKGSVLVNSYNIANVIANHAIAATFSDNQKPDVSEFTIPATATTLNVSVLALTSTDNIAVTGYLVTESSATPTAEFAGWSPTVPASYAFGTSGSKILYAWAKDAAGNVSVSKSATVAISLKAGDCNYDNQVTIAEVQSGINMFLGLKASEACVDMNSDRAVSISEVQKVINSFLGL